MSESVEHNDEILAELAGGSDAEPSLGDSQPRRGASRASLKPKAEGIFQGLWASIFYSGRASGKSVMVCSAGRQEGASTIACGLALAGGESGGMSRVALVDFNLQNPSLHKMFKVKQTPGIFDVITGAVELEVAAQSITPTLDLYAVGKADHQKLGVLRTDALVKFFEKLSSSYDYVVVDVAAANHSADAQVLAGIVKDVVIVAHTNETSRMAVAQAKKRVESGGGRIAGIVLNMRTYPIPRFLYRRV